MQMSLCGKEKKNIESGLSFDFHTVLPYSKYLEIYGFFFFSFSFVRGLAFYGPDYQVSRTQYHVHTQALA